jgi:hypothetical protein
MTVRNHLELNVLVVRKVQARRRGGHRYGSRRVQGLFTNSVAQEKDVDLARSLRHGEVVLVSWEGLKLVHNNRLMGLASSKLQPGVMRGRVSAFIVATHGYADNNETFVENHKPSIDRNQVFLDVD